MGILANPTAGIGNISGAASGAINTGAFATGLQGGGDVLSGLGSYQMGMYQSQVAQNNAAISGQNEQAALVAGSSAEQASRLKTGELIGEQKAQQGANGVDVNIGSPAAVRQGTKDIGDFDALTIRYNAARQAYGYSIDKENYTEQSQIDKNAAYGGLAKGLFDASSSFLSGSSSLASKRATNVLTGAG